MVVDLPNRRIVASVREIAFAEASRHGGHGWLRSQLGVQAHQRYQREQAGDDFEAEVPVEVELDLGDMSLTLRGRIDALRRTARGWCVEELKSVTRGSELVAESDLEPAKLQARLYALCIDLLRGEAVEASVVLLPLVATPPRTVEVLYRREAVLDELGQRLDAIVADAAARERRAKLRRAAAGHLRFPFAREREPQRVMMDVVREALEQRAPLLVQAPTGTGKTVCALLSSLRHALQIGAQLWFVTPKTTQQKLVAETFERLAEAPAEPLRACTLTARARMCPPGDLRCHPDACAYLRDFDAREGEQRVTLRLVEGGPHVSPDEVFRVGIEHQLCPYELNRLVAEQVDLVIGDYNYLFDPAVGQAAPPERPFVVVIDEAHNLADRAREQLSVFVSRAAASEAALALRHDPDPAARALLAWVERVGEAIGSEQRRLSEQEVIAVDGCAVAELDASLWRSLAQDGQRLAGPYVAMRWARAEVLLDDPAVSLASDVRLLAQRALSAHEAYLPHVAAEGASAGAGCGVMCLDAADHLELCHRRARGTIAMSATLTPLDHQADRLGFARLAPHTASLPSPFERERRLVRVVAHIRTTFAHRDEDLPALARLVEETVAVKPGAYAVFFPSYAYLDKLRRELALPKSQLLVQLPASTTSQRARQLEELRSGVGTRVLLAVMGGVFAEGIDLPGDALSGAIVVGVGLPPLTLERLAMRAYYDARGEDGQACALVYPGLRKVVQAAGRVLRHCDDVGVVVLVGRRFADEAALSCLPEDWYRYHPSELVSADLQADLEHFWRGWQGLERHG